jgi:hypothetical protein
MKKLILTLCFVLLFQTLFLGIAGAEYQEENDIVLSIDTGIEVIDFPLGEEDAQMMFDAQENIHKVISDYTGFEVDHCYIWIEVNGERVLAIDPPAGMY